MPRYGRDGPRTRINNIVVTGYQKRRTPSKHYVFIIDVTWDNDERYEVFRRYSEFFSLQETLTAAFSNFSLPNLPKRILLGRSHVKRVAEARLEAINLYCQSLVRLDEIVAESKHVTGFFSPKIGDQKLGKLRLHRPASLHPMKKPAGNVFEEHCVIAAFEAEGPSQISAESGDQVLVLNKDNSGWWLIERKKKVGWIPSSYLKKTNVENKEDVLGLVEDYVDKSKQNDNASDASPRAERKRSSTIATAFMGVIAGEGLELDMQEYKAIDSYEAAETSQLSFETGEVIMVVDKMEDGWWFASKGEEEGWVPCGYLEPISKDSHEEDNEQMSATVIEKFRTIGEYKAEEEDEISFPEGVEVEVVTKSLIGWWLVRYDGKEGVAPATFLKKIEEEEKKQEEVQEAAVNFSKQQQVPRQKTVRRKASSKQLNLASLVSGLRSAPPSVITEETEGSPQRSQPSDAVSPENDNFGGKPFRKQSDPRILGDDPNDLSPSMPRRPRPTQIRKAISTPNTGLTKPSPERERSPSPKPKPQPRKRNQDSHAETEDEATGTTAAAAAQLVQATLHYVLVTKDPGLVAALKNAIAESPELRELLKD